jgi:hypothetical protein
MPATAGTQGAEQALLIVGAGASGMLSAISARHTARAAGIQDDRFRIILLERNTKPGAKIAISGGGHCNVTHDGPVDRLLEKGFPVKAEQRFLRHAIHAFTNADMIELLGRYGVQTLVRPDGRVFPVSGRALDVLDAMRQMLSDSSAEIVTSTRVDALEIAGTGFIVRAGAASFAADAVILSAGGASWSSSGTTGDGLRLAHSAGHVLEPTLPALAPVFFAVPPKPELVGVSLRGISLVVESDGVRAARTGDLLISHRGVSGPACLSLSRTVAGLLGTGGGAVRISVDLFPGHDAAALAAFILDHAARQGSQFVRTFLQRCPLAPEQLTAKVGQTTDSSLTIPNILVPEIMRLTGIGHEQMMSILTRKQRQALVSVMKRLPLGTARKVPLDKAEVSAGGVSLTGIDPKTMQSRLHPGLYCCGEMLDYAGEVGGFNLQAAFSTGWLAGMHAARSLFHKPQKGSAHPRAHHTAHE